MATTITRDEIARKWLRDYSLRNPDADIGESTEPWVKAYAYADRVMPIYARADQAIENADPTKRRGDALTASAEADGVYRRPAFGSSGYVTISTGVGGSYLYENDELVYQGMRFRCLETGLRTDGAQVGVQAISVGISTNLFPGTALKWSSPRPGCGLTATVAAQSDGTGLTGGKAAETEDEYRDRWIATRREAPGAGNDAQIRSIIEQTPGVSVLRAFTYRAILGPASTGFTFLTKPATLGGSRIPNGTQMAAVLAQLRNELPGSDTYPACDLVASSVELVLRVAWTLGAAAWADLAPWPAYGTRGSGAAVVVSAVTDATHFTLDRSDGDYSSPPIVGQTLAVWDDTAKAFRRKQIKTITGTGPWVIVCETLNGASDTTYTPIVAQRVSPWSDSLASLVTPLLTYMETLGPGEQVSTFLGDGYGLRRSPRSPAEWPSVLTTKAVDGVQALPAVFDATLVEPTTPYATPVGTPGVASYQLVANGIAAFPL